MSRRFTIADCHLVDLPKITDARGNLTFVEGNRHIPFDIQRVYYLYDVPAESTRAGHAHKALHQLMVAISGSFDVHIEDGQSRKTYHLNRPYTGLILTPMVWRDIDNFSSGAVCMVMASMPYDESDYYRNYDEFLKAAAAHARQDIEPIRG